MYGPRPKGNMATLMRLAATGLPLPLGGLKARRSLLGVDNFADAVRHVLVAAEAAGRTFLVADDETVAGRRDRCRAAERARAAGAHLLPAVAGGGGRPESSPETAISRGVSSAI